MWAVWVVGVAAVLAGYILVGYPLLLRGLAGRRARPVQRQPFQPRVSVIIAVYNGERFLEEKLRSVLELDYPRENLEVIVASDGSTDQTVAVAMRFAADGVKLLSLPRGGKPAALNAAVPQASGEILVLTDVRQRLEPESISRLMENFADPAVGVASGELRIRKGSLPEEADIGLYWRFESWIRNNLGAIDSMFGATGPFYAVRANLAVPIPPDTLLDDVYLPLAAFFRGHRLVVDPRARCWDYSTSLDTEFRRKVRTLAGNYQILLAYPALLGPGNRMWLHFVSYKFGRLLLPWLLIAIAVGSVWLPEPWKMTMLVAQAAGYGLAILDPWIPAGFFLKRISSPARTFLMMMVATLAGLSVFFVPARSLWKVTSAGKLSQGANAR